MSVYVCVRRCCILEELYGFVGDQKVKSVSQFIFNCFEVLESTCLHKETFLVRSLHNLIFGMDINFDLLRIYLNSFLVENYKVFSFNSF